MKKIIGLAVLSKKDYLTSIFSDFKKSIPYPMCYSGRCLQDAISKIRNFRLDCVLFFDVNKDFIELYAADFRKRYPNIYPVLIGPDTNAEITPILLQSSLRGYVTFHEMSSDAICSVIHNIERTGFHENKFFSSEWRKQHFRTKEIIFHEKLTCAEQEILNLFQLGWNVKRIGHHLYKSEHAIRFHLKNLKRKAKVNSLNSLLIKTKNSI
ncbi:MAG TPA: hypothetical protein DDX92_01690 [Flavobacteriales bacterium]|jgi:DNA-binding NarL/FixJ family response regulator|nr:hypothetical protein [Flavobacteriales bacterium]